MGEQDHIASREPSHADGVKVEGLDLNTLVAFDAWLTERADWLKRERDHGGDWEHLLTREKELGYIAQKFRAALSKAKAVQS